MNKENKNVQGKICEKVFGQGYFSNYNSYGGDEVIRPVIYIQRKEQLFLYCIIIII